MLTRNDGRAPEMGRPVTIETDFVRTADGSCLICTGNTKVICTASVEENVPPFLRGKGQGWVTAEYAMLPASTGHRKQRDGVKRDGRGVEISRLIGRSLRQAVDLTALGERTITLDCDVLQADGGTRTAAITGAMVALVCAVSKLLDEGKLLRSPITHQIAAISVGVVDDTPCVDLCYEEDSLTERFSRDTARKLVDIAVIRLPKISNFTDFSPFERYENVSLRYVDHVGALGTPDMILLPGTKSTIADLRWLRERGLEAAILKEAAGGTLVFGVCGGYQMLGRSVSDPEGVEAAGLTELRGMGLLEMETVFHGEKVQRQTAGVFSGVEGMLAGLNELRYEGYEIHMGRSEAQMPALAGNGNVYGSYVHGIFDAPGIADEILKAICARRGVAFSALGTFDRAAYRERQYDLLADAVRAGLDMEFVYRVLRKEI